MKYLFASLLLVISMTATGNAQEVFTTTTPTAPVAVSRAATEVFAASSSTKVVKGAPFSADGISESVQVLADGNRITRRMTTKMYRDAEGRFRRESAGGASVSAPATSSGFSTVYGFQDTISIFDPVENVRILLSPSSKTARRVTSRSPLTEGAVVNGQAMNDALKRRTELEKTLNSQATSEAVKRRIETEKSVIQKIGSDDAYKSQVVLLGSNASSLNRSKSESLGTKSFEGVEAEGTRTTTTIPAGTIGNEKPIEITYERWHSKELDLIVYSRRYDPRLGEQIYRLTNISRSEPDRSLFSVPTDYKVVAEPPLRMYTTKP